MSKKAWDSYLALEADTPERWQKFCVGHPLYKADGEISDQKSVSDALSERALPS